MGYRTLFKALDIWSLVERGSLLPKPSHVKVAHPNVNNQVFEKLGSPFHIGATFLGKGGREVQSITSITISLLIWKHYKGMQFTSLTRVGKSVMGFSICFEAQQVQSLEE